MMIPICLDECDNRKFEFVNENLITSIYLTEAGEDKLKLYTIYMELAGSLEPKPLMHFDDAKEAKDSFFAIIRRCNERSENE